MSSVRCSKCKCEMERDDAARPEIGPDNTPYWVCPLCRRGKFTLEGLPVNYE